VATIWDDRSVQKAANLAPAQQEFLNDIPPNKAPSNNKKSDDNEKPNDQDNLLEQREKSATPYAKPDFSTPAERVVPIPIRPAPEDFRGFEPLSPGDWNLPEPRRQYPLPKSSVPAPPPASTYQTWIPGQSEPDFSAFGPMRFDSPVSNDCSGAW
jgi:hypothetical protein